MLSYQPSVALVRRKARTNHAATTQEKPVNTRRYQPYNTCVVVNNRAIDTTPAMAADLPQLARVRTQEGVVLCERCEIPKNSFGRARGLLGRDGLEPGEGMLIDRAGSVHMFFMRFPIDVVFLDRGRTVVGVRHGLRPWRVAAARRAVAALELPEGAAAAAGVETGDVLVIEDAAGSQKR